MNPGRASTPLLTTPDVSGAVAPPSARPRRTRLLALLVVVALMVPGSYLTLQTSLSRTLEDLTGETVFKEQVENLLLLARQRPVETADVVPVSHNGVYPYGVNTFFEQEVEEWKLRRSMELLREAGVRWVRQQVPWERFEPNRKGDFTDAYGSTWAQFDRVLSLAREYGLEVVARPDLPPPWARSNPQVPFSAPARIEDYGDFLDAFARRYQGWVRHYQVWNEPNLVGEWGSPPDAARYVALLREASSRLRAVDPGIVVLSAALSPTLGTPDGLNRSDLTYLQEMYEAGAAPYFDILSAQGYGLWSGPGNRRTDPGQINLSRVRLLREIMVRNGDAAKAVWIAEYGWNALPTEFPGPATHGRVTAEQQARYTVDGLRRIQQEWPWVGVVFTWHWRRVSDEDRNQVIFYYRLMDPDFTPRPVYLALQQLTLQEPVVERGWFQEDHWALRYAGGWQPVERGAAGAGRYHQPTEEGAAVEFTFRGTAISLLVLKSPEGGRFRVAVDGAASRTLDAQAAEPRSESVEVARGLWDGLHQVRVEVQGEPGLWGLDGLIVERDGWPGSSVAGGAVFLAVTAAGALALRARRRAAHARGDR